MESGGTGWDRSLKWPYAVAVKPSPLSSPLSSLPLGGGHQWIEVTQGPKRRDAKMLREEGDPNKGEGIRKGVVIVLCPLSSKVVLLFIIYLL